MKTTSEVAPPPWEPLPETQARLGDHRTRPRQDLMYPTVTVRIFAEGTFPVRDGLVVRMDDIPTTSLREVYSPAGRYWWLPDNFQLQKAPKDGGGPYSDEELDARFPDRVAVAARLPARKKLTNL